MKDLIKLLKQDFEEKKKKNPLYSLRSLARQLDIQPGTISHVLNGKRRLTTDLRLKIYDYLNLSEEMVIEFESKNREKRVKFVKLENAYLDTVSDWHFDAILELMRNRDFKQDIGFIARRLGITVKDASEAIEKLFQINRLSLGENGKWVDTIGDSLVYSDVDTTVALKGLQTRIAEKSKESISNIPKVHREHASMCMAISKDDLPWVREKIMKFHQELCEHLQKREHDSDEVYQLMTSFFPLTQIEEKMSSDTGEKVG